MTTPQAGVGSVPQREARLVDVLVVGGGQSGVAVGYHLRRLGRRAPASGGADRADGPSFVVLDSNSSPGGAWLDGWPSLRLFSPAALSSLPGWPMPPWSGSDNPSAAHVVAYLAAYEARYDLPVERPTRVDDIVDDGRVDRRLTVTTDRGSWLARVVVNATGTWSRPFWPRFPGIETFGGRQLHTADYAGPDQLRHQRVLVVGGGNSAAQVAADLQRTSTVVWAARRPPRYLPDDIDGRALFEIATAAVADLSRGRSPSGLGALGDIVAVPAVRLARDEHDLRAVELPDRLTPDGAQWGSAGQVFDAVIWCTGFRPALGHLDHVGLARSHGHPATTTDGIRYPVRSTTDPRILFVGYGDWCGPASATLIGVNRAARDAAADVVETLRDGAD